MPFSLPALPYASDALEPSIDQRTMEIHHGKHHNAYVGNLNSALESAPGLQGKGLEELLAKECSIVPENIRTAQPPALQAFLFRKYQGSQYLQHKQQDAPSRCIRETAQSRRPRQTP